MYKLPYGIFLLCRIYIVASPPWVSGEEVSSSLAGLLHSPSPVSHGRPRASASSCSYCVANAEKKQTCYLK